MPCDLEVILGDAESLTARTILGAMIEAARDDGVSLTVTKRYTGCAPYLMLWGVGRAEYMTARERHLAGGGHAILWDMGYVGRGKHDAYVRVTIDHDHPWRELDRTPADPIRWESFGIPLREDANPDGHVVLACLGRKSVAAFHLEGWDDRALSRLRRRFPTADLVRREKPRSRYAYITPIEDVLRGARLVVCRHSNVAVDAVIAGIPFECEDGAAYWLREKPYTVENRLDFLHRLCWWQWTCYEAPAAWRFIKGML